MARRTSSAKTRKLNAAGPKIREHREAKKLSQADLARKLQLAGWDIDFATMNRIEKQTRTLTDVELILIAKVLGVRLGQFE